MITLYSGIPGSGKSFKMVAELSRVKDKFYVVHNIDGLREGYLGEFGINFVDYCNGKNDQGVKMEVVDFLSKEFQISYCEAIREKYDRSCLVIIDEAHEWFSSHSKTLRMWLSYHRHLGQEIWLVAHRSSNLPSVYRSFIEVEYRAKSGSLIGIPGRFAYNRILGGQRVGYVTEKKNQEIFALYKSQLIKTDKKRKVPLFFPIIVVLVVFGVAYFFLLPQWILKKGSAKDMVAEANASVRPVVKVDDLGVKGNRGAVKVENPDMMKAVVPLPAVKKELNEIYAYVGNVNEVVILENRDSGIQVVSSKLPGRMMLISIEGLESCEMISGDSGQRVVFYNSNRHVSKAADTPGRLLRPEVAASEFGGFKKLGR